MSPEHPLCIPIFCTTIPTASPWASQQQQAWYWEGSVEWRQQELFQLMAFKSSKKLCWDPALLTRLTHDLTPYFQAAQPCTGEREHSE